MIWGFGILGFAFLVRAIWKGRVGEYLVRRTAFRTVRRFFR